jgi:hypothetical protein
MCSDSSLEGSVRIRARRRVVGEVERDGDAGVVVVAGEDVREVVVPR